MTSDELARRVEETIRACRERVLGVGHDQYADGDRQAFERMSPLKLIEMAREEVQDLTVYAVMTDIQLQKIEEMLRAV